MNADTKQKTPPVPNVSKETVAGASLPSRKPVPKDIGVRTYAKDLAQAQGKETPVNTAEPSTANSKAPTPDASTKNHPGIPLNMVVMHREPDAKQKIIQHTHKAPSTPAPDFTLKETVIIPGTPEKSLDTANIEKTDTHVPLTNLLPPLSTPFSKKGLFKRVEKTPTSKPSSKKPIQKDTNPSPIHTYKSDFSDHLHDTKAKRVDVLAAEQDAKRENRQHTAAPSRSHTLLFAISGALLFSISVLGVLYAYKYNVQHSTVSKSLTTVPALITSDSQKELPPSSGKTLLQYLAEMNNTPISDGSIIIVYQTHLATTSPGVVQKIPSQGGELLSRLSLPIPSLLAHTIARNSTVGVIRTEKQTRPFFILRVSSYDAAFAGMLDWEHSIANDFSIIYPKYPQNLNIYTGSTTPKTASSTVEKALPTFRDETILNHDTRVLRDEAGNSIMLYGFWNKNILIIARNPTAFAEIITRLGNLNSK